MENQKEIIDLDYYCNSRKSFYNKCRAEKENNIITLYSYDTEIIKYDIMNKKFIYIDKELSDYSNTTIRHLKSYLYYIMHYCSADHLYNLGFLYELPKSKLLKILGVL